MAKKILNIKNKQQKVNDHLRKHFFTCVLWSATENFAMNHSSSSLGIVLTLLLLYFSATVKSLVLPFKHLNSTGQGTRPSAGVKHYIYTNFNTSSVPTWSHGHTCRNNFPVICNSYWWTLDGQHAGEWPSGACTCCHWHAWSSCAYEGRQALGCWQLVPA